MTEFNLMAFWIKVKSHRAWFNEEKEWFIDSGYLRYSILPGTWKSSKKDLVKSPSSV
ncbi:hypothetical protein ACPOM7_24820 [Peribacillus castrilensis]|uniref:hypothetical protein n=1 Tax=Bacillaceae TaxID=186817 RepID=UPI000A9B78B7|nr:MULTISPECIES: hypothetical protein [Bacillaceae]MCP1096575.1 hypothetical protein [Bacillaceae bacterium OS4b]MBD8590329.1 hypothetical protein [Peribacillus simplex]MCF7620962.1 hypothetical protein [Peribacillus frigoritolerans]MCP1151611.1 hypothetical protein [Peribacillus frigoritolerans]MCT1390955.1 hypothetical protein [Peribacillus frigoritolerans]